MYETNDGLAAGILPDCSKYPSGSGGRDKWSGFTEERWGRSRK